MNRKTIFSLIGALLALVLISTSAMAVQTVAAPAQGKDTQVGGLPLFVSFSATTESSEAATTITFSAGFYPDVVVVVDDSNATNPSVCTWFKGMANPSAILTTGSTGANTYLTTTGLTVASGSIAIGTGCQVNSGDVKGYAIRYAQ